MMRLFSIWREKYLADPEGALTVAHIPARLGSSRLPKKNIKVLNGLPLIAYSILLARSIPEIDVVYVNTESPEVAETARRYGAEVPVMRPAYLAEKDTPMKDAIQFFFEWLRESELTVAKVVTMYPTSPFRNVDRVRHMLAAMNDYVFVHKAVRSDVDWHRLLVDKGHGLTTVSRNGDSPEQVRPMYKTLGNFAGHSCTTPWDQGRFEKVFLPMSPLECIDIDTERDWELAKFIMESNHFDFGMDMHAERH